MDVIAHNYKYFFEELSDHRLDAYPFMSSPWQLLGILLLYLYGIYFYLPSHMTGRKPYNLTGVIRIYNILQVVVCTVCIYGLATSGWTTDFNFGCKQIDNDEEMAMRGANFLWWVLMLKLTELSETVIFVLRKKTNQVSTLHVYHHVSTIVLNWLTCKVYPGGMFTFSVILNCLVHILMYTYYLLASFGPAMQKKLQFVKSKLTLIQLIQLTIFVIHTSQSLFPSCHTSRLIGFVAIFDELILVAFFANFYIKNYMKKTKKL